MYRPAATPKVYARIDDAMRPDMGTREDMQAETRQLAGASLINADRGKGQGSEAAGGRMELPAHLLATAESSSAERLRVILGTWRNGLADLWGLPILRTGVYVLLIAAALLLAIWQGPRMIQALAAAPLVQQRIEPAGDILTLPATCLLGRLQGEPQAYVRFDGQYPSLWPSAVRLPFGFYNRGQGKLALENARPGDARFADKWKIAFRGLVRGTPDELIAYFRKQLSDAGMEITYDGRTAGLDFKQLGEDPGKYMVSAQSRSGSKFPAFDIKVSYLDDMDGWTYVYGYCLLESKPGGQSSAVHPARPAHASSLPLGG
jgi:hypothetical protein